jgi:enoyl-CoA hydratase/carnithine racemase
LRTRLIAAVNGDAHAGGFATVIACEMAVAADDATFGLPEAAKGLFPFIALAIVKDALPKKLLFDLVYSARLMNTAEARAAHVINEVVPRSTVLERAIDLAAMAGSHSPRIVALGRDLYYAMRGEQADEALEVHSPFFGVKRTDSTRMANPLRIAKHAAAARGDYNNDN